MIKKSETVKTKGSKSICEIDSINNYKGNCMNERNRYEFVSSTSLRNDEQKNLFRQPAINVSFLLAAGCDDRKSVIIDNRKEVNLNFIE